MYKSFLYIHFIVQLIKVDDDRLYKNVQNTSRLLNCRFLFYKFIVMKIQVENQTKTFDLLLTIDYC